MPQRCLQRRQQCGRPASQQFHETLIRLRKLLLRMIEQRGYLACREESLHECDFVGPRPEQRGGRQMQRRPGAIVAKANRCERLPQQPLQRHLEIRGVITNTTVLVLMRHSRFLSVSVRRFFLRENSKHRGNAQSHQDFFFSSRKG